MTGFLTKLFAASEPAAHSIYARYESKSKSGDGGIEVAFRVKDAGAWIRSEVEAAYPAATIDSNDEQGRHLFVKFNAEDARKFETALAEYQSQSKGGGIVH